MCDEKGHPVRHAEDTAMRKPSKNAHWWSNEKGSKIEYTN